MPQRFLKPGITTSQRFNAVSYAAQTFYIRLITLVDDFGRYDAEPRLLRSHAFPFGDPTGRSISEKALTEMCEQLSASGLAVFYKTSDGKKYLELIRWVEKARANKSKFPAFDESCEQMFADANKCSSPSSSSSSSSSIRRHSPNGSQVNTSEPQSDEIWLVSLKESPAYQGIDVIREHAKMIVWCRENKKQATRRRFIRWLNKVDKPLRVVNFKRQGSVAKPQPEGWDAWRTSHYPDAKEHDYWRVPDDVKAEFKRQERKT